MTLLIFGLTITSSWGNGHATLWRGLCRALTARGHRVVFFERDVPYYAAHRDLTELPGGSLVLYEGWADVCPSVDRELRHADAAIISSYCADALQAAELVRTYDCLRVFYDLDTPITLARVARGERVEYLPAEGLGDFHLVLSYAGGRALDALRSELRAREAAPLYGSVDPDLHRPGAWNEAFEASASYLGTYAADRQPALDRLFLRPAADLPARRFVVGGSLYPDELWWPPNVRRIPHVAPAEHGDFYASSSVTVNITRAAMKSAGYCPSGRLFEAAACGAAIMTDKWPGIEEFFQPGEEIFVVDSSDEARRVIEMRPAEQRAVADAGRRRALREHTAAHRAGELEALLDEAAIRLRNKARSRRPSRAATSAEVAGQADDRRRQPRAEPDSPEPAIPPQQPDQPSGEVGSEGGSGGDLIEDVSEHHVPLDEPREPGSPGPVNPGQR